MRIQASKFLLPAIILSIITTAIHKQNTFMSILNFYIDNKDLILTIIIIFSFIFFFIGETKNNACMMKLSVYLFGTLASLSATAGSIILYNYIFKSELGLNQNIIAQLYTNQITMLFCYILLLILAKFKFRKFRKCLESKAEILFFKYVKNR